MTTWLYLIWDRLWTCRRQGHCSVEVAVDFAYFSTKPNQCFRCLKRGVSTP